MMMKEAAVDIVASLAVAALLILAFQNIIGDLVGVPVKALFVPQTLITLAAVVAIVFVVAALIPARLYSNIPIASAIRNYKENKRRWKLALLFANLRGTDSSVHQSVIDKLLAIPEWRTCR